MTLSRRRLLELLSAAILLAPIRRLLAAPITELKQTLDTVQQRCFAAWIETLMPADEVSPGAGELGVPLQVADKAAVNPDYLALIRSGCRWLDTRARERGGMDFAELDEAEREAVVRLTESAERGSMPRSFFEQTLRDTYLYYYARQESWGMLDYRGPPQPLGFMDYTRPPQG